MSETVQSAPDQPVVRFQCRHIRASGRPCGVAALRDQFFCYYHVAARRPIQSRRSRFYESTLQAFGLPIIEDRISLQQALSHVISRIASNDVDAKRAGKLLYGLQLASTNITLRLAERDFPPTALDTRASATGPQAAPEPEQPMADPVLDVIFGPLAAITEIHTPTTTSADECEPTILSALQASVPQLDPETRDRHTVSNSGTSGLTRLSLPNQHPRSKHQAPAHNHLQAAQREARLEVLMPDQSNHDQLNPNNTISPRQRRMHIRNQERQRVQKPTDECHQPGHNSAEHRITAPRQFAIIRQTFRERHQDPSANR